MSKEVLDEIIDNWNETNDEYQISYSDVLLEGLDLDGFELVEQDGGYEGGGENCYSVFKWNDQFYKATYNYYSHHGFDFDYLTVNPVSPKKKEVIVYE